ncbi:MAG: hypothetical protein AAGG01_24350, partial [Planctomycetota bacterium]
KAHASRQLARWILILVTGITILGAVIWVMDPYGLHGIIGFSRTIHSLENAPMRLTLGGRVLHADGRPADAARVRATWTVTYGENASSGVIQATADASGRFEGAATYSSDGMADSKDIRVKITVKAVGANGSTRPSETIELEVEPISNTKLELRLGSELESSSPIATD